MDRDVFDYHGTHGLDIEVAVKEDRLLLRIFANLSQNYGRKLELVPIEVLGAEILQSGLDTEGLKLIFHVLCHFDDILAVGTVAGYTEHIRSLSFVREI